MVDETTLSGSDSSPRTAALRWFAGAYLLLLGMSFLVLPRGPINPLYGLVWLRGPLFVLSGLAMLWLCTLRLSRRASVTSHLLAAVPPVAVAAQYIHLHAYAPAVTLLALGIGIALSPFAPPRPLSAAWRPDALGLVLGIALVAQGIDLLARPQPGVIPFGLYYEMAVIFLVFGLAIVFSHLLGRAPTLVRFAAHVGGGAGLLALWVILSIGVSAVFWVLNASVVLAGVATLILPWLSQRMVRVPTDTVRARLAVGLLTGSLIPLLIAVPIVLAHRGLTAPVPTSTRQVAFGVTLLLSIAAAVGGWWLARLLILPLSRLVVGVGRIAEGARPVSLSFGGPTEVEELAAAVQMMAGKLDSQMEEVKQARDQHRAVAEKLQRSLQVTPGIFAGVDLAHVYQSASEVAELGGDFYDVFRVAGGRIGILIGDVSGKGLDAAAQAVLMRTSLRPFTYYTDSPAEVLGRANALLLDMNAEGFVTAFFGILDPDSGELVYALAGHPPAIVAAATGLSLLEAVSPVLGVFHDASFKETRTRLSGGETLVLYTDGLTEARQNGDFFGEHRLLERVRSLVPLSPRELTQSLYSEALAVSGGRLGDDVAILAVRLHPASEAAV